jgi:hypothetical protein
MLGKRHIDSMGRSVEGSHCEEGQSLRELLSVRTCELHKVEAEKCASAGLAAEIDERWLDISKRDSEVRTAYNLVFWKHVKHVKACRICSRGKSEE